MSNSGSTYKDSFTIRYDNPTDTDRDTTLFQLGSDNPNRAIPVPTGAFLGVNDNTNANPPYTAFAGQVFYTEFFPTTNKIIQVSTNGTNSGVVIYDLETGKYQGSLFDNPANYFPACQPVIVPNLAYEKANGETGLYDGIIVVWQEAFPLTGFDIKLYYLDPNDFTLLESQFLDNTIVGVPIDLSMPILYNEDLDIAFCLDTNGGGFTAIKEIRTGANIGTGIPFIRPTQSFSCNWIGSGYPAFGNISAFKIFTITKPNFADLSSGGINGGAYKILMLREEVSSPFNRAGFLEVTATFDAFGVVIFAITGVPTEYNSSPFMQNVLFNDVVYSPERKQFFFSVGGFLAGSPTVQRARILCQEVNDFGTLVGVVPEIQFNGGINLADSIINFGMVMDSPRDRIICLGYLNSGSGVQNDTFMIVHNMPSSGTIATLLPNTLILFRSPLTSLVEIKSFFTSNNCQFSDDDNALFVLRRGALTPQKGIVTIKLNNDNFDYFFQSVDGSNNYETPLIEPYPPSATFNNFITPNNGSLYFTAPQTSFFPSLPFIYFSSASGSATANGVIIGETSNQTYAEVENSQIGSILDVQSVRINIVASASELEKQNQILTPLIFAHIDSNGNDIEYAKVPTIDPFQAQFVIPTMKTGADSTKYLLDGNTRLDYNVKKQTSVDVTFNYSKIKNLLDDTRRGLEELQVRQLDLEEYDNEKIEDLDVVDVKAEKEEVNLKPSRRVKKGTKLKRKRRSNAKLKKNELA